MQHLAGVGGGGRRCGASSTKVDLDLFMARSNLVPLALGWEN